MGGARPGAGRKPIAVGFATVGVMVKMSEPQRDKYRRLGGAPWMRAVIEKALEPE